MTHKIEIYTNKKLLLKSDFSEFSNVEKKKIMKTISDYCENEFPDIIMNNIYSIASSEGTAYIYGNHNGQYIIPFFVKHKIIEDK